MLRSVIKRNINSLSKLKDDAVGQIQATSNEMINLVKTDHMGYKAVASRDLKKNEIINTFSSPIHQVPNMHTVCFDEDVHVPPNNSAEFISHACSNTNTKIMVSSQSDYANFVVTKDVKAGEDLSFNYNTTEWHMSTPFLCGCGACKQKQFPSIVRGFKHLSPSEREDIIHEASNFIKQKARDETFNLIVSKSTMEVDRQLFASNVSN